MSSTCVDRVVIRAPAARSPARRAAAPSRHTVVPRTSVATTWPRKVRPTNGLIGQRVRRSAVAERPLAIEVDQHQVGVRARLEDALARVQAQPSRRVCPTSALTSRGRLSSRACTPSVSSAGSSVWTPARPPQADQMSSCCFHARAGTASGRTRSSRSRPRRAPPTASSTSAAVAQRRSALAEGAEALEVGRIEQQVVRARFDADVQAVGARAGDQPRGRARC